MPVTNQSDDPLASMPDTLSAPAPPARDKPFNSPSGKEIIQQETGIHPFKSPVAQAVAGPFRAVWGLVRSPYDLLKAAYSAPQTGEEAATLAGAGHGGLLLDRMLIHPAIAAHKTGTEMREAARGTRAAAQKIESAANDPERLKAIQKEYSQYDLSTPDKARKVASDINRTAISNFAMSLPAELGALPILGPMGQQAGARMASGDILGAVTESVANAFMMGAPETVGKVIPHEYISKTLPKEVVSHLIRPMKGDLRFGKDPAEAILEQGITGWTLDAIGDKVTDRLQQVGRQIDAVARNPRYANRRVNVASFLQPLDDAITKAAQGSDEALFNRLVKEREELTTDMRATFVAGKPTLNKVGPKNLTMTPYEALKFKRTIGDRIRWSEEPLQEPVNKALGGSYRNIDSVLDTTLGPEFEKLNKDYSNLVGAAKAIQRRIPIAKRNAHWSLSDIALGTHSIPMAVARKAGMLPIVRTTVPGALYRLPKPATLVKGAALTGGAGQAAEQGTRPKTAAPKGAASAAAPATDANDPLASMPNTLSSPMDDTISRAASSYDVDPNLIRAVVGQESGGKAGAVSVKGATGLMQLMPETAKQYGVTDATDPEQNIAGGTRYLHDLLVKHNGDVEEALKDYYGRGTPPPGYPTTDQYAADVLRRYASFSGEQSASTEEPQQPPPASAADLNSEAAQRNPTAPSSPPDPDLTLYPYYAHKGDHWIGSKDRAVWFDTQTGQRVQ